MKCWVISFDLWVPVRQAPQSFCEKGIITPVNSSNWVALTVILLKDAEIAEKLGENSLNLKNFTQRTCTTEGYGDVFYRLADSNVFWKIDLTLTNTPGQIIK